MSRRSQILFVGVVVLVVSYLAAPVLLEKWLSPQDWTREFADYAIASRSKEAGPKVLLWYEAPADVRGAAKTEEAARFTVVRGEAFVDEKWLPKEKIRDYLDSKVAAKEIAYVVVFSVKGAKWGEIVPIVEECRKSRVRMVLLNYFET